MCAVEWKKLGDVCEIKTGKGITTKDCCDNGQYPIISGGVTPMGMYHQFNRKANTITISRVGANAGFVNFVTQDFYLNDKCFSVIQFDDAISTIDVKYLFFKLKSIEEEIISLQSEGGVPTINTTKVGNLTIPIPSLAKQQEIVSQLDTFTTLISNLESELDMRRKQYEHYRNQLLNFEGVEGVEWKKIESIAEIGTGSSNTKDELDNGLYPFFVRSQQVRWQNKYEYDETAIITSGDGVGVGKIFHYIEGKYALHQRAYRIHILDTGVVPKYVYNYMKCKFYDYIMMNAFSSSVTSVRRPMLLNFEVPIPLPKTQQEIVEKLDAFEQLIQSLETEIKLRKQQYEYYREKLLTFD